MVARQFFFKLGKRLIKVSAANLEYLDDLTSLLAAFRSDGAGRETLSYEVTFPPADQEGKSPYRIFEGGKQVFETTETLRALFRLEWLIVQALLDASDLLQFHSGVVEKDGACVLFPATQDSGKTSLAIALSMNGFNCFSDEIALVDTASLLVSPFLRNIHMEKEIIGLFSDRDYGLKFKELKWKELEGKNLDFASHQARADHSARVRFIVFPKYSPDHDNRLKPLTPAKAMFRLLQNEINFYKFQGPGMDAVEKLVRGAECFELETGELKGAVEAIKALFF